MDLALEEFDHALDASADLPKAFEAIDKMLTDAGDWTGLARAYRRMLKRVGHDAPERPQDQDGRRKALSAVILLVREEKGGRG